MLKRIWLTPPLAFGRVGGSAIPSDAFMWGRDDLRPGGTGQTTLQLIETFNLDADGVPTPHHPDRIVFRDELGIRPVCPYFELHGTWTMNGRDVSGPVTEAVLDNFGIKLSSISWRIHCANLKAFHYTYEEGDRIDAVMELRGNDTVRHTLEGRSPAKVKQPLVPKGVFVPLGAIQAARPTKAFPEIRLRFYAPPGLTYGPTNIDERIKKANFKLTDNLEWRELKLPPERKILNRKSRWATYVLETSKLGPFADSMDMRNMPQGLFAFLKVGPTDDEALSHALGLVDDVSDGIITCTIPAARHKLTASARIVVGPPDYGPVSRPPISIADNLTDRARRGDARKKEDWSLEELRDIVADIFERASETSDLMHKDYQNWRCHQDNLETLAGLGRTSAYDIDEVEAMLWPDIIDDIESVKAGKASPHRLSEGGERKHRRYGAVEYLEMRFRENPGLFDAWIRRPLDPKPFFDRRMPALMRGSDTKPWHLTRRQWELVRLWVDKLQAVTPTVSAAPKPGRQP
jgi:hypothetical protein